MRLLSAHTVGYTARVMARLGLWVVVTSVFGASALFGVSARAETYATPDAVAGADTAAPNDAGHTAAPHTADADQDTDPGTRAMAWFLRGNEAYVGGNFEEAIEAYRKAYELSHDPAPLFNIAQSQRRLGDCPSARDTYTRYLELEPNPPDRTRRWLSELEVECAPAPAAAAPPPEQPPSPLPAAATERQPNHSEPSSPRDGAAQGGSRYWTTRRLVGWSFAAGAVGSAVVATTFAVKASNTSEEVELLSQRLRTDGEDTPWDDSGAELERRGNRENSLTVGFGLAAALLGGVAVAVLVGSESEAPPTPERSLANLDLEWRPGLTWVGWNGRF